MKLFLNIAVLATALSASYAGTLSVAMTVDDDYEAYISTDPNVQGTFFMEGQDSWNSVETATVNLTPGVKNYLHIRARDVFGNPQMLIGTFKLTGDFRFANGTQSMDSNIFDMTLNKTGFGQPHITIKDLGANGTSPWGPLGNGISSNARFIWSEDFGPGDRYFAIPLNNVVPEPATALILGGALVAFRRRRAR